MLDAPVRCTFRQPDIAQIVQRSIHKGADLGHYELAAYVIMANHVHLLIWPKISPDRLLKSLKGAAAREANRLLARTGEPFWQRNRTTTGYPIRANSRRSELTLRIIR